MDQAWGSRVGGTVMKMCYVRYCVNRVFQDSLCYPHFLYSLDHSHAPNLFIIEGDDEEVTKVCVRCGRGDLWSRGRCRSCYEKGRREIANRTEAIEQSHFEAEVFAALTTYSPDWIPPAPKAPEFRGTVLNKPKSSRGTRVVPRYTGTTSREAVAIHQLINLGSEYFHSEVSLDGLTGWDLQ